MNLDVNWISALSAVAQTILALMAVVLSVAIPIMMHKRSQLIARLEYEKGMREAWMAVDTVALSSEEMLRIADRLIAPGAASDSPEMMRKRWFVLMMMNPIKDMYYGAIHGLYGPKQAVLESVSQILYPIMQDEDAFRITQGHGYEKEFSEFCKTVRSGGLDLQRQDEESQSASVTTLSKSLSRSVALENRSTDVDQPLS